MKKIFYFASCLLALMMVSCEGNQTVENDYATGDFATLNDADLTNNEKIFKNAIVAYINNTVFPTYAGMSDNAIKLADQMTTILNAAQAGNQADNTSLVEKAGEYWTASRMFWEQSEAFLYGPAADYSIDPHIDSWPFDQAAFEDIISDPEKMAKLRTEMSDGSFVVTDGSEFDEYGLMGYHALEYALFALTDNGQKSTAHKVGDFTVDQWTFMAAVANDLRNQSILLEAAWKGYGRVSAAKRAFLDQAKMKGNTYPYLYNGYAAYMLQPGVGDKKYATYQEAAEQLIAGCIDIADEVGNSKIGAAANAIPGSETYEEDHDNIESPYSLHSIIDFQDNIVSIQHAFFGALPTDASVNDFVKQKNNEVSQAVTTTSAAAIAAIALIQEPFVEHAKDPQAKLAIAAVEELQDALKSAWAVVSGTQWIDEEE
ncbi:MAG: hypothetical protein IJ814_07360 [Paludibacteraceae bacterium]|nr:hypothetical protein [Paludibacteraceae bacterium]